jgi:hypothetical protein
VLAGLELLLPLLLQERLLSRAEVEAAFPAGRPWEAGSPVVTDAFVEDQVLAQSMAFMAGEPMQEGAGGLTWPGPRDASSLAWLPGSPLESSLAAAERSAAAAGLAAAQRPLQFTREGSRSMSEEWAGLWASSCQQLSSCLAQLQPGASALAYLYARLGYDAGCIMAALQRAGLSWGTYQDAMTDKLNGGFHCNAHSNNLVVVAEGAVPAGSAGSCRLLSMLDTDMAFDAASFVDTGSCRLGQEPAAFARLLHFERISMCSVLSGADSTSGVPMAMKAAISTATSAALLSVRSALTDTLVLAYQRGCAEAEAGEAEGGKGGAQGGSPQPPAVPPFDAALHRAAHALMRLAIIVMADYAA